MSSLPESALPVVLRGFFFAVPGLRVVLDLVPSLPPCLESDGKLLLLPLCSILGRAMLLAWRLGSGGARVAVWPPHGPRGCCARREEESEQQTILSNDDTIL